MLATSDDATAATISFASSTDAVAVAMEQWSRQLRAFIAETFTFLTVTLFLQRSEYFANISI
jgi:hypothetical protein